MSEMKIVELDLANARHIAKFQKFYDTIFSNSFPRDEIGECQDYLDILAGSISGIYDFHLTFIEISGQYVACYFFFRMPTLKSILAQYACVTHTYRGQGLSTRPMREMHKRYQCDYLFCEIDKNQQTNLSIWHKFGFKRIPIHYVQLPLGQDRKMVNDFMFCVLREDKDIVSISSKLVRNVIWLYYRYTQFCDNPDENEFFKVIEKECHSTPYLILQDLPTTHE